MLAIIARVISTCFALTCFSGTLFVGLINANDGLLTLGRALLIGAIAWLIGLLLGALLQRSVNEHIQNHRIANPMPTESTDDEEGSDTAQAAVG